MLEHTNSQSEAVLERFNSVLTPPLPGKGVGQARLPAELMPSLFKWLYQPFTKDEVPVSDLFHLFIFEPFVTEMYHILSHNEPAGRGVAGPDR